jgi:hypothetical protein
MEIIELKRKNSLWPKWTVLEFYYQKVPSVCIGEIILNRDGSIAKITTGKRFGNKEVAVDTKVLTKKVITDAAATFAGHTDVMVSMDTPIYNMLFELPGWAEKIATETTDDQIFNAFMNRG